MTTLSLHQPTNIDQLGRKAASWDVMSYFENKEDRIG
jgi:hypothetical protein